MIYLKVYKYHYHKIVFQNKIEKLHRTSLY